MRKSAPSALESRHYNLSRSLVQGAHPPSSVCVKFWSFLLRVVGAETGIRLIIQWVEPWVEGESQVCHDAGALIAEARYRTVVRVRVRGRHLWCNRVNLAKWCLLCETLRNRDHLKERKWMNRHSVNQCIRESIHKKEKRKVKANTFLKTIFSK